MKDKHCKATFPADIFAACCGATSALSLDLVTLAVAARDCCLDISFIEPIKCFDHLLSKHSVDIKHKLIALSCVMVVGINSDIGNTITRPIGVIAAVGVFVAVPWEVRAVLVSTTESIFASVPSIARTFTNGARCFGSAIVVWRSRIWGDEL